MGKTSKPLTIVALPPCDTWEELEKLEKQGHKIFKARDPVDGVHPADAITVQSLLGADIVLGSNCWRMDHQHKSYLTLAIKEARMLKYRGYEDKADSKKRASVAADLDVSNAESSTN